MVPSPIDFKEVYSQPPPPFGKEILKYFALDPEYVNLNNGAYGSTPKAVLQAATELAYEIESNPDHFHKITYQSKLVEARTQVAKLVNAHPDEVVLVPNITTAVNTVLRNFEWDKNDVLIGFSTSYGAVNAALTHTSELAPFPKKHTIPLLFPATDEQILENFRIHLRSPEAQGGNPNSKRLCVIDAIVSNPGVSLPWKEMVKICKEEGVWSLVDAAHSIGQEVGIDLTEVAPDFWVSVCHKWLMCKRSCAAFYIPFRNQHVIKASVPTSFYYTSMSLFNPTNNTKNIQTQFEWVAMVDFSPYLTIPDALQFREWLGGEEKINEYCHDLALKGGKLLAEKWGTQLMDSEGNQTLNMVNVELPLRTDANHQPNISGLNKKLLEQYKVYSAFFYHNEKWWTRCSAQVFNDLSDFERLGDVWLDLAGFLETQ